MSFADDLRSGKDPNARQWSEGEIQQMVAGFKQTIERCAQDANREGKRMVKGYLARYYWDGWDYFIRQQNELVGGGADMDEIPLEILKNRLTVVLKELGFHTYSVEIVTIPTYRYEELTFFHKARWVKDGKYEKTIEIEYHW